MKFLKVIALFALFLSIPELMKRDFKLPPSIHFPHEPKWDFPPPNPQILSILSQPFTYLAHGNQSTVFESQDGQYVLKLFRYKRSVFSPIRNAKSWVAKRLSRKPKQDLFSKTKKTLNAAFLAHTEAPECTQVVFCHLNLTQNLLPTTLLKAHRVFQIPLDRYRFVLQKKVTPFNKELLSVRNNPEEMLGRIHSLIRLIQNRSAKGIHNSDPNLEPNFGFLNSEAVEIDFGNYCLRHVPQSRELAHYLYRLKDWFKKNAPEYVDTVSHIEISSD